MTAELAQVLGTLSPFAVLAIVVLSGLYLLAPSVNRISASNDRLATAYSDLNKTLTAAQQESAANAKAIGGLAESTSQTGVSVTNALEKIAFGLDTTMQRQSQSLTVVNETKDLGTQTLASVTNVGNKISAMDAMVGEVLKTVLALRDAVKILDHQTTMTLDDWKPLDEMLMGVERRIKEAISAQSNGAHTLPADTVMYTTERNANGSTNIETQGTDQNVPPEATDKPTE